MAKTKQVKEAGTTVIVFLVLFILTTIGLGVFAYVLSSDQQAKDDAVAKAQGEIKAARTGQTEAEQIAVVHRVFSGVAKPEDLEKFALITEGSKPFQELKELIELYRSKTQQSIKSAADKVTAGGGKVDATGLASELEIPDPEVDANKQLRPPSRTAIDVAATAVVLRAAAVKQRDGDRDSYTSARQLLANAAKLYEDAKKEFDKKAKELPAEFKVKMDAMTRQIEMITAQYNADRVKERTEIDQLTALKDDKENELRRQAVQINRLSEDLGRALSKKEVDPLQFDEPQGKITGRLDNMVYIDLGSNVGVTRGLTFTVLPYDYPEKGRSSQIRSIRVADDRGNYRTVQQFIPKATIEVVEVLGPNLSRARVTDEYDRIRDGILSGDLLYNAVWRKGQTDHIALIGIFDINGDGSDDIAQVVRELRQMGIVVDAWFDLATLKWVGRVDDRTRYLVEGYTPTIGPNDPNRATKVRMVGAMKAAKDEAKNKGVPLVNFRDFFGRMGYKVRGDVSEERISQAAAKYLGSAPGTIEAPEPPP